MLSENWVAACPTLSCGSSAAKVIAGNSPLADLVSLMCMLCGTQTMRGFALDAYLRHAQVQMPAETDAYDGASIEARLKEVSV
jgi:hypothetical protein